MGNFLPGDEIVPRGVYKHVTGQGFQIGHKDFVPQTTRRRSRNNGITLCKQCHEIIHSGKQEKHYKTVLEAK